MYTSGSVHGTGTKSTILNSLETFYTSSLANYASYLDPNAGFCNDRQPSTSSSSLNGSGGTGTVETYYAGYIRMTNNAPSLKCTESSDLFTKSGATKGNKALTYPVGLITVDEVAYAGSVYGTDNTSYYLYNNKFFWTMTPAMYSSSSSFNLDVWSTGKIYYDGVWDTMGVRPVINLRADVTLSGSGTTGDPYTVS